MEQGGTNLDDLRNGKEVRDGCFAYQIKKVEDLRDHRTHRWFETKCARDELVFCVDASHKEIEEPVILKTLPVDIKKLPKISGINICTEGIFDVEAPLEDIEGVRVVRLEGNYQYDSLLDIGIFSVDPYIDYYRSLGDLCAVSQTFSKLSCLSLANNVEIDSSRLASVIPGLCQLKELDLEGCGLKELPANFCDLAELTKLILQRNEDLESLPEDMCLKLKNLQELDVSYCEMLTLPSSLGSETELTELNLCNNSMIESIPPRWCSQLKKLKKLNVSFCDLRELPANFNEMTELISVYLICNRNLQSLPDGFSNLKNLEGLYVSMCDLHELPLSLGDLSELTELSLGGNDRLHRLPEELCLKLAKLRKLDLGGCGLEKLPLGLKNMTNLTSLNLRSNRLVGLPIQTFPFDKMKKLAVVNLSDCGLVELPSTLSDLTDLTKLELGENKLIGCALEQLLSKVQKLKELDLHKCGMKEVPSALSNLAALTKLDLSGNEDLKALPEVVCLQLGNLRELNLQGCSVIELPSSFDGLAELTSLNLSTNKDCEKLLELMCPNLRKLKTVLLQDCGLKELPVSLGQLAELTELYLGSNKELESFPESVCLGLKRLKSLYLNSCGVKEVPFSLSCLNELTDLNLDFTKDLRSFPELLCSKLKSLKILHLHRSGIKELPSDIGDLANLKSIDLRHCPISELPPSICNLNKKIFFPFYKNPLVVPPLEVCEQGFHAVRAYFSFQQRKMFRRFKIICLGEACSGKTSLLQTMIHKLSSCTMVEDRTIGVEEYELPLGNGKEAKVLDCGGQKSYQLTNQLFVSESALILLVVDINEYQLSKKSFNQHIGRYLQIVYDRSRRNKVVIVFSQCDRLLGLPLGDQEFWCGDSLLSEFLPYKKNVFRQLENFLKIRKVNFEKMLKVSANAERQSFFNAQDIKVHDEVIFTSAKHIPTVEKLEKLIDDLTEDSHFFPTIKHILPIRWLHYEKTMLEKCAERQLGVMKISVAKIRARFHCLKSAQVEIVLSYFHQVGSLLYFYMHKSLKNVVFGSSKVVIDILKHVFCHKHSEHEYQESYSCFYQSREVFRRDRQQLVDCGTTTIRLLKTLLDSLELDDDCLDIVVNLLLAFDFAYVKPDPKNFQSSVWHPDLSADVLNLIEPDNIIDRLEDENACLLLPWLLTEECPAYISEEFPLECPTLWIEVAISLSFASSLPLGVFQQFSARCNHHTYLKHHWNSGFLLKYGPVVVQFTCDLNEDDPWIHCRGRAPKSSNALIRLFHVLWRCVVELEMLLKTVPGCLFDTFLAYNDGEEKYPKQQISIFQDIPIRRRKGQTTEGAAHHGKATHTWKLEAASGNEENGGIEECSQAVNKVMLSVSKDQALRDAFPNSLGSLVTAEQLRKIAREVLSYGLDRCSLLADSLYVDCKGKAETLDDIKRMLRQWKDERGKGAMLAVLADALEECKMETIEKTFLTPSSPHSDEKMQQQLDTVVGRDIIEIVCDCVDENIIRPFGRQLLNKSTAQVKDVIARITSPSEQAYAILEAWVQQKGKEATLGKLLTVCSNRRIDIKGAVLQELEAVRSKKTDTEHGNDHQSLH